MQFACNVILASLEARDDTISVSSKAQAVQTTIGYGLLVQFRAVSVDRRLLKLEYPLLAVSGQAQSWVRRSL